MKIATFGMIGARAVAPLIGGNVLAQVNAAGGLFEAIAGIISSVEVAWTSMKGGDVPGGIDKLNMALPFVRNAILGAEFFADKKVVDETRFTSGLTKIIGGIVDILHSVDHKTDEELVAEAKAEAAGQAAARSAVAGAANAAGSTRIINPIT